MKLSLPFLALLAGVASAAVAKVIPDPKTIPVSTGKIPSYTVFYTYDTPEETKSEAKRIIEDGGGCILYEYKNFNGFAATIPTSVMELVQSMGDPTINPEQVYQLDQGTTGTSGLLVGGAPRSKAPPTIYKPEGLYSSEVIISSVIVSREGDRV
ncbi:hypothetical protein FKW77_002143 [Venturia effusa]|uniref:Inhibitor I9 domain-containing protein n=1 Tax=Venturia effusa TaxID=50376 RepID=A0A517L0U5_9PEZI|nr:hypothetical protein FKW77_002143 [Venturia effusa]